MSPTPSIGSPPRASRSRAAAALVLLTLPAFALAAPAIDESVTKPEVTDPCLGPFPVSFRYRLGTGVGPSGLAPSGTPDDDWVLTSYPLTFGGPSTSGPAFSHGADAYPSYWVTNPGLDTAWINHDPVALSGFAGTYVYERTFYVPPYSFGVDLDVSYAADNGVTFTLEPQGATPINLGGTPAPFAFQTWNSLPTNPVASKGVHRLVATVQNNPSSMSHSTKTGLNADVILTGTCEPFVGPTNSDPCASPLFHFRQQLGTGRDANGLLTAGSADPFWQLLDYPIGYPGPTGPGTAFSRGVDPIPNGWAINPTQDTGWINHDPLSVMGFGGDYAYRRFVYVPVDAANVQLQVSYTADNNVTIVLHPPAAGAPITLASATNAFTAWHPLNPMTLGPGLHRLEATVENAPYPVPGSTSSPTGLDVSAVLTGKCRLPNLHEPGGGDAACLNRAIRESASSGLGGRAEESVKVCLARALEAIV